ncbi:MAG: polyphosphate kinase 2 family protein [Blautia sp.]|nr:polyphosphate kinase 2 family protein [Blautia sp.]
MSLLDQYCYDGSKKLDLSKLPTNSKKDNVDKEEILKKTKKNQEKIFALQDKLYAEGKEGLLIVLQARDAAGKDSTIRHVMGGVNPQGVQVYSYKQPSKEELAHDYLWRCVINLPKRGMISLFNRSYYEDVLVVKVHKLYETYKMAERCLDEKTFIKKRFKQIRNFEEYLYDNSYRVVKIFLNVSADTQKERFLERLERPEKHWKFSSSDIPERELWNEYNEAYEETVNETSTKECPWYVIPADQKWYSRYLVSEAILDTLKKIDPQYPEVPEEEEAKYPEYIAKLNAEE